MNYKVIILDDERLSLEFAEKIFPWQKFEFEVVLSTMKQSDALEYIRKNSVDVIMMDMCMPNISGIEMMKLIREINSKIKIIILSAYSVFEYAQQAINYDVFGYYLKPLTKADGVNILTKLKDTLDEENHVFDYIKTDNKTENYKFNEMIKYVNYHYMEKLNLNNLTEKYNINLTYCCALFKKHFNCTFKDYVTKLKMEKSKQLLEKFDLNIDDISEMLGYEYVYFCKLFKKYHGQTPRQYRLNHMENK